MTCIHEMAFGMNRCFVLPDGSLGPCILCDNDRLRTALAEAAACLEQVGWRWKDDAARARAALALPPNSDGTKEGA